MLTDTKPFDNLSCMHLIGPWAEILFCSLRRCLCRYVYLLIFAKIGFQNFILRLYIIQKRALLISD